MKERKDERKGRNNRRKRENEEEKKERRWRERKKPERNQCDEQLEPRQVKGKATTVRGARWPLIGGNVMGSVVSVGALIHKYRGITDDYG